MTPRGVPRPASGTVLKRDEQGRKFCYSCREHHDPAIFNKDRRRMDGLALVCKRCCRNNHTKYRYKLTLEDLERKFAAQNGRCPICGMAISLIDGTYRVDHDHACCPSNKSCGKCVRDLLCGNCNTGMGQFSDSPKRLRDAANYLEEWNDRLQPGVGGAATTRNS